MSTPGIEEWGRRAAASARRSVEAISPRPGPGRRASGRTVAAVGAVGIALVIAGALFLFPGRERPTEVAAGGPLPRLAPSYLPAGLTVDEIRDARGHGAVTLPITLHLYGVAGEANPFASADLAVFLATETEDRGDGEPVRVRGHDGVLVTDTGLSGGGTGLTWVEHEELMVGLFSRSLHADDLVAVAEAMDPTATDPGLRADDLPAGLSLVTSRDGLADDGSIPPFVVGTGEQYTIRYSGPAPSADRPTDVLDWRLEMTVTTGTVSDLDMVRWWYGPTGTDTEIRGRPAVVAVDNTVDAFVDDEGVDGVIDVGFVDHAGLEVSNPSPTVPADDVVRLARGDPRPGEPVVVDIQHQTVTLAWLERDDILVVVVSEITGQVGVDEHIDELHRVAESVREMSAEEWGALRAGADVISGGDGPDAELPPGEVVPVPDLTVLASGEAGPLSWRLTFRQFGDDPGDAGVACLEVSEILESSGEPVPEDDHTADFPAVGTGWSTCAFDLEAEADTRPAVLSPPNATASSEPDRHTPGPLLVVGAVRSDTARVVLELEGGEFVGANVVAVHPDGTAAYYVVTLPGDVIPRAVVAIAASGEELGRRAIDWQPTPRRE